MTTIAKARKPRAPGLVAQIAPTMMAALIGRAEPISNNERGTTLDFDDMAQEAVCAAIALAEELEKAEDEGY